MQEEPFFELGFDEPAKETVGKVMLQEEPFFELGFDEPAKETVGKVMLGTIGWPGNFRFTFEVDNV